MILSSLYKIRLVVKILLVICWANISSSQVGVVPVRGEYLFIKATEVSNIEYREFLDDISKDNPELFACHFPDSSLWDEVMGFSGPYIHYYFRHPAFRDYPVVNIKYEDALAYCAWLTDTLNKYDTTQKVLIRLPTEKEWEYAAGCGKPSLYPWEGRSTRVPKGKHQGKMCANFVRGSGDYMGIAGSLNDAGDITVPVDSYWPNNFGIYNMGGNVEEMITERGKTKGGSWRDRREEMEISRSSKQDSASPEVGFRYILEVIKLKDEKPKKEVSISKKFFKQNFIKINDSLYGGKYEVSNKLFNLFVRETGETNINNKGWANLFSYSNFWMNNYHIHSKYDDYPVVNITRYQAQLFCKWLTKKQEEVTGNKIEFRLPTEQEWVKMSGDVNPLKKDRNGNYEVNFLPKADLAYSAIKRKGLELVRSFNDIDDYDQYAVTAPVNSFKKNKKGYYNIFGNVAEYVSDKIEVKGGSWGSGAHHLTNNNGEKLVDSFSSFVGFRMVAIKKQ